MHFLGFHNFPKIFLPNFLQMASGPLEPLKNNRCKGFYVLLRLEAHILIRMKTVLAL
jgi:hypothetical protein